jgi:hypothetical protein
LTIIPAAAAFQCYDEVEGHRIETENSISDAAPAAAYVDDVQSGIRDQTPPDNLPITQVSMPDFAAIVREVKQKYSVRIRRWRRHMSGCAWRVSYSDGRNINWIESPRPRTPISLAIFLHEVGHHVIGFERYRVRCEEEYHVWQWALAQMRKLGIEPDQRVERRFDRSMQYAVSKALRRGAKGLPEPLMRFAPEAV